MTIALMLASRASLRDIVVKGSLSGGMFMGMEEGEECV